jgi:hypothetical protein
MTAERTQLLSTTSASFNIMVSAARLRTSLVGPAQMLAMLALDDLNRNDAVDGCAGRPAEGRRCESVTVKA